jgi:transcriptional regulator with XRE-family HTH domain
MPKAAARRVALLLARLKAERGMSHSAVAERLGVSVQTIGHWKRGVHVPKLHHLVALAALGAVTVDWLLADPPADYPQLSLKTFAEADRVEFLAALDIFLKDWEIRRRRR